MHQNKIILSLAPVRGITDAVYRQAFARCFGGFDHAVAPFIQLRQGHSLRSGERLQLAVENNRGLRTIPQVLTNNPASFTAGLRELHELGHDEVNWNLGCPYPTGAGRGRGAQRARVGHQYQPACRLDVGGLAHGRSRNTDGPELRQRHDAA